jgi:hypothetical protein
MTSLKLFAILISLSILISCNEKGANGIPIPPETMKKIMTDIHIAEAYSTVVKDSLHKGGTKNADSLAVYYKDIFAHHKVTAAQFTESLNWYKNNPEEMDSLYDDMIPIVTGLQAVPVKTIK